MQPKRCSQPAWVFAGVVLLVASAQAQWQVSVRIKPTEGHWQDTLLAGDTSILQISITNPVPAASYTIPLIVRSQTFSAFARLLDSSRVVYTGRMTGSAVFSERIINQLRVNGTSPDSILYGAVAYSSNYLSAGSGVVIEHPMAVQPYVGSVRIDTGRIAAALNRLSFTDSLANEITNVAFNANPVFPVVLRTPNAGPTCTAPANIDLHFGTPLSRTIGASDPEGNALTFRQVGGPGSTTAAGMWSWSPGCAQVGTHNVCVTVSDPFHIDWDTCCFAVTIRQSPPALACSDQTIHTGQTLSYQLSASDDGCPQPLGYFKVSGPGALSTSTGLYTYSPLCTDRGLKQVQVRVSDGADTAYCQFQVIVANSSPFISCPSSFSKMVGKPIDFVIPVSDSDGDPFTLALVSFVKLSGLTLGGPNQPPALTTLGRFTWTTTAVDDDDYGVWEARIRARDVCDSTFCTFQIEITPNRKPVCVAPSDQTVHWSTGTVQTAFDFSDPDGDPISITQISGPGSLDGSGLWSWSFGCADRGVYQICAVVADSAFPAGDTCCFNFRVIQSPPALACHHDSAHVGTGPLEIYLSAPDDGCPAGPVRFHLLSGPGAIDSVTGLFTLTPSGTHFACGEQGDFALTVEATDGELADTCSFEARVYNNPPEFVCPNPDDTLAHPGNRLFQYDSEVLDPDGDNLVSLFIQSFVKLVGAAGGPNHPPSVDSSGLVSWQTDTTTNNDFGLWRLVLEARDSCAVTRCSLLVRVQHNSAPSCVVSDASCHIGDTAKASVGVLDLDNDTVTIVQLSGPGTLTPGPVNNALWHWVPQCADTGMKEVCIVVSDPVHPNADTCCFHVAVFENPPVILCQPQSVHYGTTLVYNIPFTDDVCPRAATWSRLSGPGTIGATTGRYTLPTTCADVGTRPVIVALSDGSRADTCSFEVTVTNTPPSVNCPTDQTGLVVGAAVDLDIGFSDADLDPTSLTLVSFQKLGGQNANPPNHPPVLAPGGHFHWQTEAGNANDAATWQATVRANENCASSSCSFRIEVLPNGPPACLPPADLEGVCETLLSAGFGALDSDGDPVTFALTSGPGAMTAGGAWSWTAPCTAAGVYEICATVSDPLHAVADTCCFMVSVCGVSERGDVNGDHHAASNDIILLVNYTFKAGTLPLGTYTADMNCDGRPTSADIIVLVNYVFKGAAPPCNPCSSPLFPGP